MERHSWCQYRAEREREIGRERESKREKEGETGRERKREGREKDFGVRGIYVIKTEQRERERERERL